MEIAFKPRGMHTTYSQVYINDYYPAMLASETIGHRMRGDETGIKWS